MRIVGILIVTLVLLANGLCSSAADNDRAALLHLHDVARQAHLQGNADLLATALADQVVNVENGRVEVRSRQEMRDGFAEYFGRVKYSAWENVQPPAVNISPDGHMAWMVIQIKARLADTSGPRAGQQREFASSWIATFEKQKAVWKMVGISSGVAE